MKVKELKYRLLAHITSGKKRERYKKKWKELRFLRRKKLYNRLHSIFGQAQSCVLNNDLTDLIVALKTHKYKGIYVMGSCDMGWFEVFKQRHHHIADYLMTQGFLIVCGMNPVYDLDKTDTISFKSKNLMLANFYDRTIWKKTIDTIAKYFDGTKCYHLIGTEPATTIDDIKYVQSLNFKMVYEYFDEISKEIFPGLSETSIQRHDFLLKDEQTLVVCTSDNLFKKAQKYRTKNIIKSLNGVCLEDWENPQTMIPKEMDEVITTKHKIIGFYGSFAPWIDFDIIKNLALARPDYEIVMIGYDYEWGKGSFAKSKISELKNVHIIPSQPYNKLKYFAQFFDVAMLPFKLTEVTKSVSPVKLFEYMAQGIPVVSTDMQECRKYDVIYIGKDSDEFIKNVDTCMSLRNDENYVNRLKKMASENTWSARGQQVLNAIHNMEQTETDKNPILSIAIPCYNMEKYIVNQCLSNLYIDSLANDVELIVVDDGSSDRSIALVEMYNSLLSHPVKLIKKENGGHGSCINAGIKNATGKYFKLVDADDFCDPIALLQHVQYLKNCNSDVVMTNYNHFFEGGATSPVSFLDRMQEKDYTLDEFISAIMVDTNFTSYAHMHAVTIKTDCLKDVTITEHSFYVDNEYITYPLKNVKTVSFQNIFLYQYFLGRPGQSVNPEVAKKRAYQNLNIIHNIQSFLEGVSNPCLNKYILNILYHASIFYVEKSDNKTEKENLLEWWKVKDKEYFNKLEKLNKKNNC
ncbi:MAG: glycosyltransferase [Alphaproteobacteria bacterium]|nr:glycosyltransferase [Alphaproteobacteria bacterium]